MNTEMITRDFPIFFENHVLENGIGFLAKFSLYLIITRPFPTKRYPRFTNILENLFWPLKNRRHIMKSFQYLFMTFFILFVASGCYTTFYSVKHTSAVHDGYYVEREYYVDEYENDFEDEYLEESTLSYQPSRLVIKKTYFDYGNYVRRVKYVAYDYEPWYDPYPEIYYSDPVVYFNFHFGFGFYHPYRPWHPYPGVYITGVWFDPWYCYPVHYPIYYPVPVHYPYPVYYDPPYYTHHPYRNYQKRDWDRRTPTDNRRFATGGKRGDYNSNGRSDSKYKYNDSKNKSDASKRGVGTSPKIPQEQKNPTGSRESARRNTDTDRKVASRAPSRQIQPRNTRSNLLEKSGENTRIINTRSSSRNNNNNRESNYSNQRNQGGTKKNTERVNNRMVQSSPKSQTSSNSAPRKIASSSERKSSSQGSKYSSRSSNKPKSTNRSSSVKSNNSRPRSSKSYSKSSSRPKSGSSNTRRSSSGSSRNKSDKQQKSSRGRR